MTTVLVIVFAVVSRFLGDEVKAWFAWLHRKVRRTAVAMLPKEHRERYDEEWERDLEEYPGEIFKLIYSVGLLIAGARIRKGALRSVSAYGIHFSPLKRLFDILFSSTLVILFVPLFLAIGIAIKLETRGPIFSRSKRIGKNGRPFCCIKFRTMAHPTEGAISDNMHDPQLTSFGRYLCETSLDELPQLLNVLVGDMSVVGPRPPIGNEMGEYGVLSQRPGLTGLRQIAVKHGRRNKALDLDLAYARNWSIWLDFKIIARSLAIAATGRRNRHFR
jgi:lipopolysaccharide/colanic/teichoic acid biosynthesis glycosyltransferase